MMLPLLIAPKYAKISTADPMQPVTNIGLRPTLSHTTAMNG